MSSASSPSVGQRRRTFTGRSAQGCSTRKKRKVKCDGNKPICNNCRHLKRVCVQSDGTSADLRAEGNASTTTNAPVSTLDQLDGSTVASVANSTPAASSNAAENPNNGDETQMDEPTEEDQDREEMSAPFQDETSLSLHEPSNSQRDSDCVSDNPFAQH